MSKQTNDHLQRLVEQLYGDERLTDSLTDEDAKILLRWGEGQLREIVPLSSDEAKADSAARQLRRVIRTLNRLVGQRADLSDTELIQRLLRAVEQAMQLAAQKSLTSSGLPLTAPAGGEEEA